MMQHLYETVRTPRNTIAISENSTSSSYKIAFSVYLSQDTWRGIARVSLDKELWSIEGVKAGPKDPETVCM